MGLFLQRKVSRANGYLLSLYHFQRNHTFAGKIQDKQVKNE